MMVTKRDGTQEPMNMDKSNKVLAWACDNLTGVSSSDIAMRASLKMHDGIATTEIHRAFIQAAEDLILDNANYAEVQARLILIDLYKRVYGDWDKVKHIYDIVAEGVKEQRYDPELLASYTRAEWDKIEGMIHHKRDYLLMGAGMKQLKDKYLVQDRFTREIFETPQVAYMLCAVAALRNYDRGSRLTQIKKTYDAFSRHKVNLPTPVLAGVRRKGKQYSSCILLDLGDSLDSINTCCRIANRYAAKRAGLGLNVGRIRCEGARVGDGEATSTGIVPFIRQIESSIKSCSQGGIRDASATLFIPIWHFEIERVLVLKSPKVSEENAVRRLDYCAQWDSYLLRRATQGKDITLFSPHEVPELYEAFFGKDRAQFEALYERLEQDDTLKFRKVVSGRALYESFLVEASESGRIYTFMADHVNTHTPFLDPIYMSNLCVEVTLPTQPVADVLEPVDAFTSQAHHEGMVQLCILGAINLGNLDLNHPRDLEERYEVLVTFLNELIDDQDYLSAQSRRATMYYRPLGIGVINFAYFLAKRGLKYSDQEARDLTHRLGEQMYYYGLKASMEYAKYKGKRVPAWDRLIYSQNRFLFDTYHRRVDELTSVPMEMDWPTLMQDMQKYGIYNSTIGALMPSESSSTVSNATSAMDPIRSLVTSKSNKKITFRQVAPEANRLKNHYDMLWDMDAEKMGEYIKLAAVFQKFMCQSMSLNFSYNPEHYPDGRVPLAVMMNHTALLAKYGLKTRYYVNTKGEDKDKVEKMTAAAEQTAALSAEEEAGCESGACAI